MPACAAAAAARSPPRLRASLGRVVFVHSADQLGGPCGAGFWAIRGARKSCVLVRSDANSCAQLCPRPTCPQIRTAFMHSCAGRYGPADVVRAMVDGAILLCSFMHLGYAALAYVKRGGMWAERRFYSSSSRFSCSYGGTSATALRYALYINFGASSLSVA